MMRSIWVIRGRHQIVLRGRRATCSPDVSRYTCCQQGARAGHEGMLQLGCECLERSPAPPPSDTNHWADRRPMTDHPPVHHASVWNWEGWGFSFGFLWNTLQPHRYGPSCRHTSFTYFDYTTHCDKEIRDYS